MAVGVDYSPVLPAPGTRGAGPGRAAPRRPCASRRRTSGPGHRGLRADRDDRAGRPVPHRVRRVQRHRHRHDRRWSAWPWSGSLTVLPALLSWLGRWADRGRIPFLGRAHGRPRAVPAVGRAGPPGGAAPGRLGLGWPRLGLLALAAPALGLRLGNPPNGGFPAKPAGRAHRWTGSTAPSRGSPSPAQVVVTGQDLGRPRSTRAIGALRGRSDSAHGPLRRPVTAAAVAGGRALLVSVPLAGNGTNSASDQALLTLRGSHPAGDARPRRPGQLRGDRRAPPPNYDDIAALRDQHAAGARRGRACWRSSCCWWRSGRVAIPLVSIALNLLSVARRLRADHAGLPGRPGLAGLLGFTSYGGDRAVDPAVHLRVPVRAEHGLPRVHPEPDPGAARRAARRTGTRWWAASPAAPGW